MDNFPPMRLISLLLLTGAFLASSCKKEDPMLKATLHAKCRECVVSYASGVSQSKKDTLLGVVDQGSGDTIAEERQWTLQLKDGDNIFLRACHLDSAMNAGALQVWIDGDVRPDQAQTDGTQGCAEINHTAHAQ